MSSSNASSQAEPVSELTPAPTLKAPRDAAFDAKKSKTADKVALKNFFMAKEIWVLPDLSSSDKTKHGTPVSLIHAMLRIYFGNNGVDWQAYLLGGCLGKIITEAT